MITAQGSKAKHTTWINTRRNAIHRTSTPDSVLQLMRRTGTSPLLVPPLPDAPLVELAPTDQPRHLGPSLEFLEANHALSLVALLVQTILLGRDVRIHAARRHAEAVAVAGALAVGGGAAHAAGALGRQALRGCLGGRWRWRAGVDRDAVFDVLDTSSFVAIGAFCGEFVAADGAFVFFRDLAAGRWGRGSVDRGGWGRPVLCQC